MKLTHTIVSKDFNLVGFRISGTSKEFGGIGNAKVENNFTLKYLMNAGFNNSQVFIGNNKITEKGSFHINQLPMLVYTDDKTDLISFDNRITLISRYVHKNENVGFGVKFGDGTTNAYRYAAVIKLSEIFKCENFLIRTTEKGRVYIAGKNGSPLTDLPVVEVGDPGTAKRTKSSAIESGAVTGKMTNDVDILDIFDFVKNCNGYIINFKGTEYKATGEYTAAGDRFMSLGIGEIASPSLSFNETKLNATCRFKNPGVVNIGEATDGPIFAGTQNVVYTYVYRSKNIFYNGEHHMEKVGIIIPEDRTAELFDKFGRSLVITEVTDANVIKAVNSLINWRGSKIFSVTVNKTALISPTKYNSLILDSHKLYEEVLKLCTVKIALIYARGAVRKLAEEGYKGTPKNRDIAPQFKNKTEAELAELAAIGINIYDGSYAAPGDKVYGGKSDASQDVEIRYIIDGLDPKNYTYAKLENPDKRPNGMESLFNSIDTIMNSHRADGITLINEIIKTYEKHEYETLRTLWMHKAAMAMATDKAFVHSHDKNDWEINISKRTKATCYDCKSAAGLQVLLTNIEMAK